MAGHAAAACKAPPPAFGDIRGGHVIVPYKAAPPGEFPLPRAMLPSGFDAIMAGHVTVPYKAAPPGEPPLPRARLLRQAAPPDMVQPEQAKALSQEVVQPKQESPYLYISRESAYYNGESFPTMTPPCKSPPTWGSNVGGGCHVKANPKELPAGYKAAACKRRPPIFPSESWMLSMSRPPIVPAATVAAVDEPPAAPPLPFPQMQ